MYQGKKVRLREYRREDLLLRLEYINDAELISNITPEIPYPITLNEEEKWFQSINALKDTYRFAIETNSENRFIGDCSITDVDWKNSVASIGMFIGAKEYRGKGYGADAINILIDFIFKQMNLNKIRLIVYSFNKTAIDFYKKHGFKVEGIMREEIFRNNDRYDKIAMGMLKEEYLERIDK